MKKAIRVLCGVAVAAAMLGSAQAQTPSKKLVVYCPHPLVFIEPIVKKFEAETGIRAEVVAAGTGELLKRVEAETSNPLADVMWGGSMSTLEPSRKFFETYRTPEESGFFDNLKNTDGRVTAFTQIPSVIMVNTKLIGNIKVEGYQDVLNPALKGKIAFADPSKSSSSFEHLINMLYAMGKGDPDKGWSYVEALAKNLDGKLLSGSSAVYKGVADGEYTVGLTFEEGAATYVKSKAPVKIVYMNEGVISQTDGSAIIKGAKNLENAKKFIDFLSSKETQTMIATQLNRRSVRKDAPATDGLAPMASIKLIKGNDEVVNKSKRLWLEKFKDIYTSQ
ncbi:ABC transporter substrate-binding protein [Propionivibrio soli]|uniref:ABC transporter substrate-binding protein n=1 Tax=Propionivibrio soli TaxID=2976531 RepID=UPI0021E96231|nr:ABC transporter substrate-binding protein [Propionivibrio soli]